MHDQVSIVKYLVMMDCEMVRDNNGKSAFDYIESTEVLEVLCEKYSVRPVSSIDIARAVAKKDHRRIRIYKEINAEIEFAELKEQYGFTEEEC